MEISLWFNGVFWFNDNRDGSISRHDVFVGSEGGLVLAFMNKSKITELEGRFFNSLCNHAEGKKLVKEFHIKHTKLLNT